MRGSRLYPRLLGRGGAGTGFELQSIGHGDLFIFGKTEGPVTRAAGTLDDVETPNLEPGDGKALDPDQARSQHGTLHDAVETTMLTLEASVVGAAGTLDDGETFDLEPGDGVQVQGLMSAQYYNGYFGKVLGFDQARSRYGVLLMNADYTDGPKIFVRRKHLVFQVVPYDDDDDGSGFASEDLDCSDEEDQNPAELVSDVFR